MVENVVSKEMEKGEALDWNESVVARGSAYCLLAAGLAECEITQLRRDRFGGSAKMEAAPMAVIGLRVTDSKGMVAHVETRIILNTRLTWKLEELAKAVGMLDADAQEGTTFHVDWDNLVGRKAYCEVTHREYNGNLYNEVKRFLFGEEAEAAKAKLASAVYAD